MLQCDRITIDKKAILMKKGTGELHIRVNQWKEHLQEYWDSEIIELRINYEPDRA